MVNNRRIIEQIIEVRGRMSTGYPSSELFGRLLYLESAFEKRTEQTKELLKYYPIALVSCIESYYRLAIKVLIDSERRYLESAEKLAPGFKFDFEIIKALHGKQITIGELISHVINLNNLTDIASQMSQLLGADYLKELATVHDRWAVEVNREIREPIIKDPASVYGGVAKTFELRHIFCHEFATRQEYDLADIEKCFDSTVLFLKASDQYMSNTLHPDAPLTQAEMNQVSAKDYQREMDKLMTLNQELLTKLAPKQKELYSAVHKAWEAFLKLSVEFEGMQFEGGSMRPTIENTAAAEMTKQRIEEVERLIDFITNI